MLLGGFMYCNSCIKKIPVDQVTHCAQCGVPLCKKCANHCLVCGKELCDTCYKDNHYKCEECYKPDDTFSVIRRSHIEQYAGCPYSLYLQLILGIEPPMGKHAELGVIVHELIDKLSEYDYTLNEAINEMMGRINDWNLSTDDEYSIITMDLEKTGKECLENFWTIKDSFQPNFKSEYNIKYSIDDDLPMISCTLDRIEWHGKDIHIHDWKTGKPMSGKKLVTDLQPPLYLYAVYKEFGEMPKTFNLHYLHPNKHLTYKWMGEMIYQVETTRNTYTLDVNEALDRTKKMLKAIKNNEFDMPNDIKVAWRCKSMCWFGLSGKCSGVQSEQWKALNKKYEEEENGTEEES